MSGLKWKEVLFWEFANGAGGGGVSLVREHPILDLTRHGPDTDMWGNSVHVCTSPLQTLQWRQSIQGCEGRSLLRIESTPDARWSESLAYF